MKIEFFINTDLLYLVSVLALCFLFTYNYHFNRNSKKPKQSTKDFGKHPNDIISYDVMCKREGSKLIGGIYPNISATHSVVLMSRREDAKYYDEVLDEGKTLIYSGHIQRGAQIYKEVTLASGQKYKTSRPYHSLEALNRYIGQQVTLVLSPRGFIFDIYVGNGAGNNSVVGKVLEVREVPTNNEIFERLVNNFKNDKSHPPHAVRVYEKLEKGKWAYNGLFALEDCWQENNTYKFKLTIKEPPNTQPNNSNFEWNRIIPSEVKIAVWERDGGKCKKCGADKNLHFDHILPFSKGGTSLTEKNIQLLCMDCNYKKSDRIS